MPEAPCSIDSTDSSDSTGEVHTAIFVDVDGVLNVGIRDGEHAPLLLSQANVESALCRRSRSERDCAEKVLSVSKRRLGRGERGTFASLAAHAHSGLCDAFVHRLACLIRAAGERRTVVLSSSWRHPQHSLRVRCLEQDISRHMGERFRFDGRTRLCDERCAEDRLLCIGESAARVAARCRGRLRLLVLEDFFTTPLQGWSCGGTCMASAEAVEQYLLQCCCAKEDVAARVVHTYDEWVTPRGLQVQVGAGLTMEHFRTALDFVRGTSSRSRSGPLGAEPKERPSVADNDANRVVKSDSLKERFARSLLLILAGGTSMPLLDLRKSKRKVLEWLASSLPFFSWQSARGVKTQLS